MFKKIIIDNNSNTVSSKKNFWQIINESKNILELISHKMNSINKNVPPDMLVSSLTQIQKNTIALSKQISSAVSFLPDTIYYFDQTVNSSMKIERLESNIYHYSLNEDLPHIIRYDVTTGSTTHYYDTSKVYSGYRKAVEEYMDREPFHRYTEKIFVAFIMFYEDDDILVDVDNKDIKPFLDAAISKILVPDDNPDYVNVLLLSATGKKRTEVFAGTRMDILSVLVNYL